MSITKTIFYLHEQQDYLNGPVIKLGQVTYTDALAKDDDYNKIASFQVPYDVYGDYYVTVVTDAGDRICEAPNEDNNALTIIPIQYRTLKNS